MISRIVAMRDNRSSGQRCRGNLISAESVFDGAQALWFIRDEYVRGSLRRRRQKFVASSLPVRGNLPARGNFFCTRWTGNIFRSLAKPRQIRDPRDVYTTTSLHKFCLFSLFPAERFEFLKIEQTNNGGLFPRKFSIDYHRFHYARIVFLSVENIYTGKKISHREQWIIFT